METYREFLTEVKYKQKLKPSTLNKWKNSYLHFEGYIIEELQLPNMKFKQIQENTAKEYFNFLKEVKSISNDHSLRFASYLSQVVDYAKKKKYTKSNILSFEEMSRQKPRAKVYLEDDIFDSFASMKLHGILKQIQDIAIVICRSGVDYSDLTELQEGAKHSDYVSLYRGKNEEAAIVPILPIVRQVLKKHNYKLPQMHINTFNRHLHVFEGYLGLSFELKTKVLRKTAGTYFLNNGIRIEVVSKILGHTSIVTTQKYYADVLKKLVIKESLKLMNKPIKRRTKNLQQFI
ncbi:tyrosine-type recombinase/integrase [Pseudarcicella hirudinis]|uniref:tyrosine-type recombinase/integrase n=1 Tax=Pseudarcicella hirudinis TaxID=1079859 RepID=UPI0035E84CC3